MFDFLNNLGNSKSVLNRQDLNGLLVEVDDVKRKKLQDTILAMYKDILYVCNNHGIIPYLVGGSSLGAVRHKGFIPWDDDLDVGMTRNDYEKFIKIFNNELSDKYILNAPNISENSKNRFTKVYKKGTTCREISDNKDSLNGIFLDIFIIENIPKNVLHRTIKGIYCNFLQFIASQVYFYENDNPILKEVYSRAGSANYYVRKVIGVFFSFRKAAKWFDSVDTHCQYKNTGLYGICTGRKHYLGEIFDEKVFFPTKYITFCDIEAPIFNDINAYLENLYGDYMQLPPEEKREKHFLRELSFGDE